MSAPLPAQNLIRRIAPSVCGLALFTILAIAYDAGALDTYRKAIHAWGVDPYSSPFLDTDGPLSAARCARRGLDVYVANPCDPIGRPYNYSPLWLILSVLPMTPQWVSPIGIVLVLAFFLCIAVLPVTRDWFGTTVMALAVLSSSSVYAVERGNTDLLMFVLATVAALCMAGSIRLRVFGYGAVLLAGLLKYFPASLILLAGRERPRHLIVIGAALAIIVALFVSIGGSDLLRSFAMIPTSTYRSSMFGSIVLPGAISEAIGWSGSARILQTLFVVAALVTALRLSADSRLSQDLAKLSEAERTFLLVGALLTATSFFCAQNIEYRAIHLLFTLPALTALCGVGSRPVFYRGMSLAALGIMWARCWRHALGLLGARMPDVNPPLATVGWVLRELCWWWVVIFLLATILTLLRTQRRLQLSSRRSQNLQREPLSRQG
jgi:hypothetical protein